MSAAGRGAGAGREGPGRRGLPAGAGVGPAVPQRWRGAPGPQPPGDGAAEPLPGNESRQRGSLRTRSPGGGRAVPAGRLQESSAWEPGPGLLGNFLPKYSFGGRPYLGCSLPLCPLAPTRSSRFKGQRSGVTHGGDPTSQRPFIAAWLFGWAALEVVSRRG